MTAYNHWADEYDKLMLSLRQHWGAEIKHPPRGASIPGFDPEAAYYPRAVAIIDGRMVEVAGPLTVKVGIQAKLRMQISREDLAHRITSKVGLLKELETGDPEFDDRYFLRLDRGDISHLANNELFRKTIEALEPFASIDIYRGKLRCYRDVNDREVMDFKAVDQMARHLITLAEMIDGE